MAGQGGFIMKLLVVDGNSILNRAYYGIKLLSTRDGVFTNGIYGFLTILLKMQQETAPDKIAVAFDMRAPTFRHKIYDGYKAQRKGMPEELAMQLPYLKELLTSLGYAVLEREGWEADDILGTLSRMCSEAGGQCVVATGDRDSFQLVGGGVTVRLASTKMGRPSVENYGHDEIVEKYGVPPKSLIDVKALMGDASDNIPGVAGVGEKTALSLIAKFKSLDGVYENLSSPDIKDGVRKKLEADRDMAYLSYELAAVDCNVPIDIGLADCGKRPVDNANCYRLMTRLELYSLMEKFGVRPESLVEETPSQSEAIEIIFDNLPEDLELIDILFDDQIESFYICANGKLYYSDCMDAARRLLASDIPKRTNRIKSLHHKFEISNVIFDLEIAQYLLGLSTGEKAEPEGFSALADKLTAKLEENGQIPLLREIELPLAQVLADMERAGVALDTTGLKAYGENLAAELEKIQSQIWEQAGENFNIASPKQLGAILFEKLGLPSKKKTKTGWSTDVEVLESLRDKHPLIGNILEYRKLSKLKSTYVDGLSAVVSPDGRVRTTFQQTLTRTGRISSVEPNMQNIPVRTPLGSELRRFFVAPEGKILLDADYSQIELRVLAHIANDKAMIEAFGADEDIHTNTAAQVFGLPPDFVTPLMRSRAKAVNFGIVYGIGAYSLSQDIGVTISEADRYIKDYLAAYAGVRQYMEDVVKSGEENGYVKTLFGRRRYLPELASKNRNMREFGKRVALNAPIQGTAADIIKIAMIRVYNRLKQEKFTARLILQVHDELIVEAPHEEAERAKEILAQEMREAAQLAVKLVVDVSAGANWLEAK
jgi:DNA polymerase-1